VIFKRYSAKCGVAWRGESTKFTGKLQSNVVPKSNGCPRDTFVDNSRDRYYYELVKDINKRICNGKIEDFVFFVSAKVNVQDELEGFGEGWGG
jgi:hypothetical protein